MKTSKTDSNTKISINGIILLIYLAGFLLLLPGSLEMLWNIANTSPLDANAYFLYIILALIVFLSAVTISIKKLILKELITINFWSFIPALFFGIIYLIISNKLL